MAIRSLLIDHAAQLLGISRRTVYNRIRQGRLRTVRTRCGTQRVLLDSAEQLLREGPLERAAPCARGGLTGPGAGVTDRGAVV
jgi:excisionase family DNA binding protein